MNHMWYVRLLNEQGSVVETKDPVLVRETVSQSTADFLKEAMFQTVENGTGGAAKVAGYQVGGKTGTAGKTAPFCKELSCIFCRFCACRRSAAVCLCSSRCT